ncbi:ankyrin repeat domain-containing protein [Verrucomicrobia bacterium]|nr:ankyrin repeat domain-containing protein [Verrucomicrobiota bacterium]MDB4776881.1 ankyrin repeat domain-containing protein [Verrucomicrobiota bacterium]MDC0323609.1 ankyrin repeat domain-containing protein [Verrucomicrobiota bacterium]
MKSQTLFVLISTMLLMMAGCTPTEEKRLIELIKDGNSELAMEMINNGADVNEKDGFWEETALHAAAELGDMAVAELLISKGADLESEETLLKMTPLFMAVWGGHESMSKMLIEQGANVNATTVSGLTLIWYASEHGSGKPEIAGLLLDNGAIDRDIVIETYLGVELHTTNTISSIEQESDIKSTITQTMSKLGRDNSGGGSTANNQVSRGAETETMKDNDERTRTPFSK